MEQIYGIAWTTDMQKSEEQNAAEGLSCMESWMKELGLAMNLRELDATEEMLDGKFVSGGNLKVLFDEYSFR